MHLNSVQTVLYVNNHKHNTIKYQTSLNDRFKYEKEVGKVALRNATEQSNPSVLGHTKYTVMKPMSMARGSQKIFDDTTP